MSLPLDFSHYEIWRSVNGGAFTLIGTSSSTSFEDSDISSNNTYTYYLIAFDLYGNSILGSSTTITVSGQSSSIVRFSGSLIRGLSNLFEFNDYVTNNPVLFNSREANYSGGLLYTYKNKLVPDYSKAIPVYVGTIERNGKPFRNIRASVTIRTKESSGIFGAIRGPVIVKVLDSIPYGILYEYSTSTGEVTFYGDNIQITPNIVNPNCNNYPTSIGAKPRCYFRVRSYRQNLPDSYSDWIYYFDIKTNWSDIRDNFILRSSEKFSLDQTNIIDNQKFIDNYREKGYYT